MKCLKLLAIAIGSTFWLAHATLDPADYIPVCAIPCMEAAAASANCNSHDLVCNCKPHSQAVIYGLAGECIVKSCGENVAQGEVIPASYRFCHLVNDDPANAVYTSKVSSSGHPTTAAQSLQPSASDTVSTASNRAVLLTTPNVLVAGGSAAAAAWLNIML